MTEKQRNLLIDLGRATRAFAIALFYIGISLVICLYYGQRDLWYMEMPITVLLLYSLTRTATFGDRRLRKRLDGVRFNTHKGTLAFLWRDKGSRIELATLLVTVLLIPIDFGICSLGGLFLRGVPFYPLRRLLTLGLAVPFLLPAWYFGRRSALIRLAATPRYERIVPRAFLPQLLNYAGVAALYIVGTYTVLISAGSLVLTARFAVMAPALAVFLLAVWTLLYGMQYTRVFRARRRLYRRVRRIVKRQGGSVTRGRGLYRSVLLPQETPHFSVKVGEQTYDCRICSSIHKSQNLIFDADGTLTSTPAGPYRVLLGLFSPPFSVRSPYAFASENRKVLIVTPAVWRWYVNEGTSREVDIGEWVFDYKIYNAASFLGVLERGGLEAEFSKKQ